MVQTLETITTEDNEVLYPMLHKGHLTYMRGVEADLLIRTGEATPQAIVLGRVVIEDSVRNLDRSGVVGRLTRLASGDYRVFEEF